MRIIGLTGGAGSGKSEAAKRFAERGIPVIDADKIGHEVIGPGGAAEQDVIAAFGEAVCVSGIINRDKLAAAVFGDAAALQRLNAIVHPAIAREIARRCRALAEAGPPAVIIDAALLAENGVREPWLDGLIVVACPREERLRRLVDRRGMRRDDADRRLRVQAPPETKFAAADWVIDNAGSLADLRRRVDEVVDRICESD